MCGEAKRFFADTARRAPGPEVPDTFDRRGKFRLDLGGLLEAELGH
jgi:hypothetical protein